jgi:CYTH domain-containing protein
MRFEIERKFLVAGDGWRSQAIRTRDIRDGIIARTERRKVRVRVSDDTATLAIKAKARGMVDAEYEYPIPLDDAEDLLRTQCDGAVLHKKRHEVPHAGRLWQIDVYEGVLAGIVLAEVELPDERAVLTLPSWVGAEVTGDPRYKKVNLLAARLAQRTGTAA